MIVLIFTGGTISMRQDADVGGAVPSLTGRDILAHAPGVDAITELEIEDWGTYPGPHMTMERMWDLRARIAHHLARPAVDGVVVTHGTDSLEEAAYLMTRSLSSQKPVVFTGAMRTASDLSWDGPANLISAVCVASCALSRGRGALVAFCDAIFAAADVAKVETQLLDAFGSPGIGPVGVVDCGRVIYHRAMTGSLNVIDAPELASPVDIVYAHAGADSRQLAGSLATARAVVIAGMGRGNVPPAMLAGVDAWIDAGKPVVITTRVAAGRVGTNYGYEGAARRLVERGVILGGARRPPQARIDLMLALGAGLDPRVVFAANAE